jgi:hypothetical protein
MLFVCPPKCNSWTTCSSPFNHFVVTFLESRFSPAHSPAVCWYVVKSFCKNFGLHSLHTTIFSHVKSTLVFVTFCCSRVGSYCTDFLALIKTPKTAHTPARDRVWPSCISILQFYSFWRASTPHPIPIPCKWKIELRGWLTLLPPFLSKCKCIQERIPVWICHRTFFYSQFKIFCYA